MRGVPCTFRFHRTQTASVLLAMGLVLTGLALILPQNAVADLVPRHVPVKPVHSELWPGLRSDMLIVKFVEGSEVRLRNGQLVSLSGRDLAATNALLDAANRGDLALERLFTRAESVLATDRQRGQERSGRELADLNNYYVVRLEESTAAAAETLLDQLNALEEVEIAYAEPIPESAVLLGDAARFEGGSGDLQPRQQGGGDRTPNYVSMQGYLNAAPAGVGVGAAGFYEGGAGAGVKVIDIETGWNWNHEDMPVPFYEEGSSGYSDHGIAVTGEIAGVNNGYGISGIAHDVQIGSFGVWGYATADAFDMAASNLDPGDIYIIELHCPGPNANGSGQFGYIAMEWWQANFDVIAMATANGVICCEPAGNGQQDFDRPEYLGYFDRNVRDSGAIIVGATNGESLDAAWFTNHGTRVDLSGWGSSVVTTGYGDLQGGNQNEWYTAGFGGTSSATPIVLGTVACMQGIYKARYDGAVLSGATIARLLSENGTPTNGPELIGPRPDLAQAIPAMLNELATIVGQVIDAEDGDPLEGAEVRVLETGSRTFTAVDGSYILPIPPGSWTVQTTAFGYETDESGVVLGDAATVVHDAALTPMATTTVSGFVRDVDNAAIAGAQVAIAGTPLAAVTTDASGYYYFAEVPTPMTVLVEAYIAGAVAYTPDVRDFDLGNGPAIVNLRLAPAESFEDDDGDFAGFSEWQWGTPSYPDDLDAHSGTHVWGTDLDNTQGNGDHHLTSPTYDLSDVVDPRLAFWHWFEFFGPYDGANVSISLNGGPFMVIEPVGGYDDDCIFWIDEQPCEPGYTNSSHVWVPAVFDLNDYIGESVRFRLHLGSVYGNTAGWYMDDWAVHSANPVVGVEEDGDGGRELPAFQTRLTGAHPNPFNPMTTVSFSLAREQQVKLSVFDMAGKRVAELANGVFSAGEHPVIWNGRDAAGRELASGTYMIYMEAEDQVQSSKMMLVR